MSAKIFTKPRTSTLWQLTILLTMRCNQHCPDCLFSCPSQDHDVTLDELRRLASYTHGIQCVSLSGGEPTMHPQFTEIVPLIRPLFGCTGLNLFTNASGVRRFPEAFSQFDEIYVSQYEAGFYDGYGGNESDVRALLTVCSDPPPTMHVGMLKRGDHVPASVPGREQLCLRGELGFVFYYAGQLYPCCAGACDLGVKVTGVPVDEHWREGIYECQMPCGSCFVGQVGV